MSKPLLSLCSIPKVALKDGWTGPFAHITLPFYQFGYFFASGAQYTYPSASIGQDLATTVHGSNMTDTYQKDCCSVCLGH